MFTNVLSNAVIFDQAHPLEVSAYVNRHVGQHRLEFNDLTRSRRPVSRLRYRDFAGIGLSSISYGDDVQVRCPDLQGIYHFQVVTQGECRWHFPDQRVRLQRGQALMMNPGEKIDLTYSADCEKVIVKVPEELVRETCLEQTGLIPRAGVRFERKVIELEQSLGFMRLLDALLLEANETELDLSHLQLPYRDILIRKLLQQFDSNARSGLDLQIHDRSFSVLLAYIEAHIRDDLSVEELAQVGNVSVRTVYNLFAKYFNVTPKLFIKQSKLKSLREELKHNAAIRNVTEIALDYGFTHLGRFSSEYRKMFGELPSETLRQR
ncbi:AraC family transcriptional regulator [Marinobacterium sediminicola]|uniref:AraC-type DNA-binding protein n=1 Tax=Marinobacterium sediminicola TaxID=518898 RepID=A0ABY1S0T3_9GAMM|nr:AraC family transcriptional regulator [Marinobacterium sediminicola]ULG68308.1 AraC family transcriptional regulator [Marinobacterium sediminicola]SMR74839.1 AraC-type DNA-binding protein [Marinobacterium sediminicola]